MSILPLLAQSHPIASFPLRYRPVVLALLATWSVLLLILGMAPLGDIPINDKLMHFIGVRPSPLPFTPDADGCDRWAYSQLSYISSSMSQSTSPYLYVPQCQHSFPNPSASRRIWTYRRAPLILTLLLAFLGADIISEVVQGMLPVGPLSISGKKRKKLMTLML
jgi:hypothetical protein